MLMAQMEQSISKAPEASLALEAKNGQLQRLLGELLKENQELRFRLHLLESTDLSAARKVEESS